MTQAAYLIAARRTPIGAFAGSLAAVSPVELGAGVARVLLEQAHAQEAVDSVITGNVLAAGHGMNVSRQISIRAGLSVSVPATTVNMVCGSGLYAVLLAAQSVQLGDADVVLAGGVESMSQAGYISLAARSGARMGHTELKDLLIADGLTDAFNACHMGLTAEALASKYGISREEMDQFSLESQQKAARAVAEGWFADEISPVSIERKGKLVGTVSADEHPRPQTTMESLAALRPVFKAEGTVTAGNASGINDGAAWVLVANENGVKRLGVTPLARISGYATQGVEPMHMGIGPVMAVRKLLKNRGATLGSFDLIEANEAFAVQALAVGRELEWDPARVNVGGGAIALGHPIGASGARILVTLVHHLLRTNLKTGMATLCVGGGQGIALSLER